MEQDTRFRVRGTQTLRRLVFSNSLACMGMWDASTRELSQAFSDDVQEWLAVGAEELIFNGPIAESVGGYLRCSGDVSSHFILIFDAC